MTQGQAELLGWLVGDGHLGGSPTLTVATQEDAERAAALARDEFGLNPIVKPERAGARALRVVLTTGRLCGAGKNPLTTWLRRLGIFQKTGARKHVPEAIFTQSSDVIAAFLRGLFHADGTLIGRGPRSTAKTVRVASISKALARDVQHLLLRLDIRSSLYAERRNIGGYRTDTKEIWTVSITARSEVVRFLEIVGFLGDKHARAVARVQSVKQNDAGHVDRMPLVVNEYVTELRKAAGFSHAALGWRDQGKAMSRATCGKLGDKLNDPDLHVLSQSDVFWDEIASIEPVGRQVVYDLTVGELHNFCVDDFITHNSGSLEQESDMVAFLYREGYYNNETPEPDLTEFIIAKHRNGPTGTVKLRFVREYTLFRQYADPSHYPHP